MERMHGLDPMFLYSETAATPMEVAYACVFDPQTARHGYSFEAVTEVLAQRVPGIAPFRRRLVDVPLGIDHPRWVDDPDFELGNHLRKTALAPPGGIAGLTALAAEVMGRPLDPGQPPWEMHVVEDMGDGRVGLIAKVHHSMLDGVSGSKILAQLLDLSPNGDGNAAAAAPWRPQSLPSKVGLVTGALPTLLSSPWRMGRAGIEVGRTSWRLLRMARSGRGGGPSIPVGAPVPFTMPLRSSRAVSFAELPLAEVTALRKRAGLTLNDLVLALCSGALRAYLAEHDPECAEPLVAVVPVSVRRRAEQGALGNRLSAMFVALANDLASPLERLEAVATSSRSAKAQEVAVGYGSMVSAVSDALPPAVARPAMKLASQFGAVRRLRPGNLVVSNVPGPDFPLFFAGMRMEAVYPIGPVVDGVALNITVQSYLDSLYVGLNACPSVVPDLPGLAAAFVGELGTLTRAVAGAAICGLAS